MPLTLVTSASGASFGISVFSETKITSQMILVGGRASLSVASGNVQTRAQPKDDDRLHLGWQGHQSNYDVALKGTK
jgi:hypothetical protein